MNVQKRESKIPLWNPNKEDGEKPTFETAPRNYVPCTKCKGTYKFDMNSWWRTITREEISAAKVLKKANKMQQFLKRSGKIKLVSYPPQTLTISEMKAYLYNLEHYENFIVDVLVTDYADEFLPEDQYGQYRHSISGIWAGHKAIAGDRKIAVVTGSQSNTARTGKDIQKGDWAEDISKLGKIDGAMAINQPECDKKRNLARIKMLKLRHDEEIESTVTVLQQLQIGKIYLDSCVGEIK